MNDLIVFVIGYIVGRMATGESVRQAVAGGAKQVSPIVDPLAAQIGKVVRPAASSYDWRQAKTGDLNPEGWIR